MNNAVINDIKNALGATRAKMYSDSASMFNAKIETHSKLGYFLESSRFEDSDRVLQPKNFSLKIIGENHIYQVKDLGDKPTLAINYFNNLEFTKNNALILERSLLTYNQFQQLLDKNNMNNRAYDNGLTACYYHKRLLLIISYCEGDIVEIHCKNEKIFNNELKSHVDYYNENEA